MVLALIIVGSVIGFILLLYVFIGIFFSFYVAHPKNTSVDRAIKQETEWGNVRDYFELEKEDIEVKGFENYNLHCVYVPLSYKSNKYVIISHGYTYNHIGSLRYLHVFRELGFNVVIYDNRGCGLNKKYISTMGKKESKDLTCIVDYIFNRFGKDIYLGLHGESMGSALQMMSLKDKRDIKFLINDCGYGNLYRMFRKDIKHYFHLPKFFVDDASFFSRLIFKFSYKEIVPEKELEQSNVPICFFHGAIDDFVPTSETENMYLLAKGYKEIHIVDKAWHAESIKVLGHDEYKRIISEFLTKIA